VHDGETNGQHCYRVADRDPSTHCRGLSQGKTPQDDALTTVQTFVSANRTANLELIVSTFDEAATVFFPGRPQRASGQGEIRDVFAELFKQRKGPITITPRDVSAQLFSDVAIITAHLKSLAGEPKFGSRPYSRGERSCFDVSRAIWLIVHHHASNFSLQPAPQ
jgi:ketosteroid isomerase-like protein